METMIGKEKKQVEQNPNDFVVVAADTAAEEDTIDFGKIFGI